MELVTSPPSSYFRGTRAPPCKHTTAMMAVVARAAILALLLLRGTLAEGSKTENPLLEPSPNEIERAVLVNLTRPGDDALVLEYTPHDDESCDGVAQTVKGNGTLNGAVASAFSLADVSVATLLQCGSRREGERILDVTTTSWVESPLVISGGRTTLSAYSIRASIYDDVETGRHFIAGYLLGRAYGEGGSESYWFDTCMGSFEVGSVCHRLLKL